MRSFRQFECVSLTVSATVTSFIFHSRLLANKSHYLHCKWESQLLFIVSQCNCSSRQIFLIMAFCISKHLLYIFSKCITHFRCLPTQHSISFIHSLFASTNFMTASICCSSASNSMKSMGKFILHILTYPH